MLAVEGRPLTTEPKKVHFGPTLEPDHISESEMSDDEDDPYHNKFNAVEQVHGPLKAIKSRPEAAPVCGQNISKDPQGPT
jgi:hypothetical protein